MSKRRRVGYLILVLLFPLWPRVFADDLNAMIMDAVRYANTEEKHAAKVVAREALKTHMPAALHEAMKYVDGDHVMLQVLVMEWVLQLPKETFVPTLLDYVDHERRDVRRLSIFFLGFHDAPELAGRITKYLDDERCRGATIRTLGKWKVESVRPQIEKWLAEGKERVRVVAANALRDIGDPRAVPALIDALDDPVFTVRNSAARALVSFGDEAAERLSSADGEMAARCLADIEKRSWGDVLPEGVAVDGKFFIP